MIAPDRHPPMAPWLEQAWLMRYLDRQLGADEQAWFEGYLLDKPDLLDQVEADTALRDAVAAQQAAGILAPDSLQAGGAATGGAATGTEDERRAARPMHGRGTRGRRGRWLALAASFVGGIGLALLGSGLLDDGNAGLVANPPRIIFDTLRGELTAPGIEPGDPASPIVLVEFPVPPGARIRSVRGILGDEEMTLPIPLTSADGYATFAVPSNWRKFAKLSVEFESSGAGTTVTVIAIP